MVMQELDQEIQKALLEDPLLQERVEMNIHPK